MSMCMRIHMYVYMMSSVIMWYVAAGDLEHMIKSATKQEPGRRVLEMRCRALVRLAFPRGPRRVLTPVAWVLHEPL